VPTARTQGDSEILRLIAISESSFSLLWDLKMTIKYSKLEIGH